MDEQGGIRVGATRVLLELVIDAYREGATPETIVRWFDSLQLADVYAVISYYLKHKDEVEDYLRRREELAAQVRRSIEAGQPARPDFREELLARRTRADNDDVTGKRAKVVLMNAVALASAEAPEGGASGSAPAEKQDQPKKRPRRHLLGPPPGYKFDPNAAPTADDLGGIPVCVGDYPLRPGQSHTESDGVTVEC
jgi:uncharacterized protein (DUF433 family)